MIVENRKFFLVQRKPPRCRQRNKAGGGKAKSPNRARVICADASFCFFVESYASLLSICAESAVSYGMGWDGMGFGLGLSWVGCGI